MHTMRCSFIILSALVSFQFTRLTAVAAVGCTLSNPADDLKYLYPAMTTYKEELRELHRMPDGKAIYDALKARLGSDLDPIYETFETPYTLYTVFAGEQIIGIVHGVNVPGEGGVIQIFTSADPKTGTVARVFFQRLESLASKWLKKKEFLSQFTGLTLADFYKHDYYAVSDPASTADKVGRISSPLPDEKGIADYLATMRGIRKDLILLDFFVYGRKNDPFYSKAQESLAALKAGKSEAAKKAEVQAVPAQTNAALGAPSVTERIR